ncbi:MAG: hypothetical protein LC720_08465, partial [Actinobacteria bacterium]|nr:hypothetical protein [Actinomycetota bacterium]
MVTIELRAFDLHHAILRAPEQPENEAVMRNPVRSETDAFHIAFGAALLIAAAAAVGVLIAPIAGVTLF